jgi:hypothetical protein
MKNERLEKLQNFRELSLGDFMNTTDVADSEPDIFVKDRFSKVLDVFLEQASIMLTPRHNNQLDEMLFALFCRCLESRGFKGVVDTENFTFTLYDILNKNMFVICDISINTGLGDDPELSNFWTISEIISVLSSSDSGVFFNKEKWDELFGGKEIEFENEVEGSDETEEDMRHVVFIDTSRGPKIPHRRMSVVENTSLSPIFVWIPEMYMKTLHILGTGLNIKRGVLKYVNDENLQGLPASVMDYLVLHPEFIPEEWRKAGVDIVIFPGSIFIETDSSGKHIPTTEKVGCLELDRDLNMWKTCYRPIVSATPPSKTIAVAVYTDIK